MVPMRRSHQPLKKDHLGSLDVLVNSAGQVEQKLSFGPWGQRRDATNWEEVDTSNLMIDLGPTFDISRSTRGFTGHEMVDSVGIVHMNGRIYDPFLGRFLQADNYVQDPTNTQSHNRYSYVWNNPLNATDPRGEIVFTLFATIAVAAAKGAIDVWVIGVIFGIAGTMDAIIAGADLSDAFLTGVISGVSAGAFAQVGSVLQGDKFTGGFAAGLNSAGFTLKVFSHGMIGGITSGLQGGKFGHGFASGFFTAGAISFNSSRHFGPEGFSWKRVAVGATIGGSASKLSGGKFANGAITGAFSQALNNELTEKKNKTWNDYTKWQLAQQKWADVGDINLAFSATVGHGGYSASGTGSSAGTFDYGGSVPLGKYGYVDLSGGLTKDVTTGFYTASLTAERNLFVESLKAQGTATLSTDGTLGLAVGAVTPMGAITVNGSAKPPNAWHNFKTWMSTTIRVYNEYLDARAGVY